MKKFLIAVAVFGLAGCMSTDPYTGEQQVSNTAKGTGIGAVTGAIICAAVSSSDDRGKVHSLVRRVELRLVAALVSIWIAKRLRCGQNLKVPGFESYVKEIIFVW